MFAREDFNKVLGAPENFTDQCGQADWNPRDIWPQFVKYSKAKFGWDAGADVALKKESKAQPRAGYGEIFVWHADTGLPILPTEEELETRKDRVCQYWSAMVRQFLNRHHGA